MGKADKASKSPARSGHDTGASSPWLSGSRADAPKLQMIAETAPESASPPANDTGNTDHDNPLSAQSAAEPVDLDATEATEDGHASPAPHEQPVAVPDARRQLPIVDATGENGDGNPGIAATATARTETDPDDVVEMSTEPNEEHVARETSQAQVAAAPRKTGRSSAEHQLPEEREMKTQESPANGVCDSTEVDGDATPPPSHRDPGEDTKTTVIVDKSHANDTTVSKPNEEDVNQLAEESQRLERTLHCSEVIPETQTQAIASQAANNADKDRPALGEKPVPFVPQTQMSAGMNISTAGTDSAQQHAENMRSAQNMTENDERMAEDLLEYCPVRSGDFVLFSKEVVGRALSDENEGRFNCLMFLMADEVPSNSQTRSDREIFVSDVTEIRFTADVVRKVGVCYSQTELLDDQAEYFCNKVSETLGDILPATREQVFGNNSADGDVALVKRTERPTMERDRDKPTRKKAAVSFPMDEKDNSARRNENNGTDNEELQSNRRQSLRILQSMKSRKRSKAGLKRRVSVEKDTNAEVKSADGGSSDTTGKTRTPKGTRTKRRKTGTPGGQSGAQPPRKDVSSGWDMLFSGFQFVVAAFEGYSDFQARLRDRGGSVLVFEDLVRIGTSRVQSRHRIIVLLKDWLKSSRLAKVLVGLAAGVPLVYTSWADECMRKDALLPILQRHYCRRHTSMQSSVEDLDFDHWPGLTPLLYRPFAKAAFAIHEESFAESGSDKELAQSWSSIIEVAGGLVFPTIESLQVAIAPESILREKAPVYVVFYEASSENADVLKELGIEKRVTACSRDWIAKCLTNNVLDEALLE